jgi:hypothetical protein
VIRTTCHTADDALTVEFDATSWFRKADPPTALCTLEKTPDQIVKVLWQRLLVKDLVHRPKPLA